VSEVENLVYKNTYKYDTERKLSGYDWLVNISDELTHLIKFGCEMKFASLKFKKRLKLNCPRALLLTK
jgi:hypothetical protein